MVEYHIKDGTSQKDRLFASLDEGYFNVDEMRFEDYLSMAADYAEVIEYYDLENKRDGDWQELFTSDEAVMISVIATFNVERVEARFLNLFEMDSANTSFYINLVYDIYLLAKRINLWFRKIDAVDNTVSNALSHKIQEIIKKNLVKELHSLGEFLYRNPEEYIENFNIDFSDFATVWQVNNEKDGILKFPESFLSEQRSRVYMDGFLRTSFYSYFNTITYLKEIAATYLPASLKHQEHNPATGLYMAFARLFSKIQNKINSFTQRHLKFYYYDLLNMQPKKPHPDSTYLVFKPDLKNREVFIKQGTEFTAGKDENGQELIYVSDKDLLVNGATVESLYTLNLERNPLDSPEKELCFITGIKKGEIPVTDEMIQDEDGHLLSWPLFGAAKTEAREKSFMDSDMGIAFASPVLMLSEGKRNVSVSFMSEYFSRKGNEGLNYLLEKLEEKVKTDKQDLFFRVFNKLFNIYLTTESGWYEVPAYFASCNFVNEKCEDNCLKISFQLSHEAVPVVSYTPDIHGGELDTCLPVIRFLLNPDVYLHFYSELKNVLLREIDIEVDVEEVRCLQAYNNLGQLDPTNTFQPFGPVPSVDSCLIIGNYEIANKHISKLNLNIEWGGLPVEDGGFKEYYEAYDMEFSNAMFEADATVLVDGQWFPVNKNEKQIINLFSSEVPDGRVCRNIQLSVECAKYFKPIDTAITEQNFRYNLLSRNGFIRFSLTNPFYAFGHGDYSRILTKVLTANAKLKKIQLPLPKSPYTPVVNSISVDYKAVAKLKIENKESVKESDHLEKIFYIHPLGEECIYPVNNKRDCTFLPRYNSDGNLFIGLSASKGFSGFLTLFFHLVDNSTSTITPQSADISWYYLSSNRWKRLKVSRVVSDTTYDFLTSGVVQLDIPSDITMDNSIMPSGLFWIRVSADNNLMSVCDVYSVRTQAVMVRRKQDFQNVSKNFLTGLPVKSIKEAKKNLTGIAKIEQPIVSFNGRPAETEAQLRTRISERLKHKNRATTPWDYERLILERFPELFKVKCFPGMSREKRIAPGHILVTVIPKVNDKDVMCNLMPIVNSILLEKIRDFARIRSSSFANIDVRNPAYEQIQVRCSVKFQEGRGSGYFVRKLNQDISDYLSPWTGTTEKFIGFGWVIRCSDVKSYIQGLEYINFVTDFSMLQITEDANKFFSLYDTVEKREAGRLQSAVSDGVFKSETVDPIHPWSIAIPMVSHYINVIDTFDVIDADVTGINELEIGNTLIIGESK